jgi:DNA primase
MSRRRQAGSLGDVARAVKQSARISEVVGRYVPLRQQGGRLAGLCPFHAEKTPSFVVDDKRATFHCFGCGRHGDVIDFVMAIEGGGFAEAMAKLSGGQLPEVDPAASAEQAVQRRQREEQDRAEKVRQARTLFQSTGPIDGTLAERYLAGRGLSRPADGWPPSLRFHPSKRHPSGECVPVMVAGASRWPERTVAAVQLTALAGAGVKAEIEPQRWSRGALSGGAVRLGFWREGVPLAVTEGVEDGLAVRQAVPGLACWAALGVANVTRLALPQGASIVLVLDSDEAGRRTAAEAAKEFAARGHQCRVARLPDGLDPNALIARGVAELTP